MGYVQEEVQVPLRAPPADTATEPAPFTVTVTVGLSVSVMLADTFAFMVTVQVLREYEHPGKPQFER
jgi:hypothetical protein